MLTVVFPRSLISVFKRWITYILRVALIFGGTITITENFGPDFLKVILKLFGVTVSADGISGAIWPLFFTGVYYLIFSGILTVLLGKLEKKLDYFR